MQAKLIKRDQAKIVDLGTKLIIKYTSEDRELEVNHMKISGRHPEVVGQFVYENEVHFMLYVTKGSGKVHCNKDVFEVQVGDVVDVPPKVRFAVEGEGFEYLALQTPAWSPGQAYIVVADGNVVEKTER